MSKSQETWNKKEAEKKRLKKRQDKEAKKQERKSNTKDNKSFDDMIAYVDEFGNFTNVPPDPSKRTEIAEDDIMISIPKQLPQEEGDNVRTGVVSFFNDSKGFGFIEDSDNKQSIFVHINGLIDRISERDKVTFETESGPKGLIAVKVQLVKK
jgi:cold shock CspA family protein